ncbi:uncharacterized protein LOC108673652 [Hyalella azteca]|uniref:Uncharacterized protein LOC108673652 n=1 Tax=Hyalella azteca TaxID=294128 RepID=A0A8B7NTB6_HYAAZ|nr:uncharacterized protein LOC108673652 [Hyalella azteca]XP_047739854.1 uncharacterized protein LOC108673652 [Hyalella azteca]
MAVNKVVLLALLLCVATVAGQVESEVLPCYTCTYNAGGDDSCYKDPDNSGSVPITDCKLGTGQCCIISRSDAPQELGTPLSLYRGCIEDCDPKKIGKMETTSTYSVTTYETFCDDPRCNNGPGNVEPGSGGDGGLFIDGIQGASDSPGQNSGSPCHHSGSPCHNSGSPRHQAVWGVVIFLLFGICHAYNCH